MAISRTLLLCFELACASDTGTPDAGTFVAFAPDFAGYASWSSFDLGSGSDAGADAACVHVANVQRSAFLNKAPPHASSEFPVGTIVVKEIHAAPTTQVLAMVKRGGGYDPGSGCAGWEWFGLDVTGPQPQIQWRGVAPPTGETYASCGPCTSCHAGATTNDCVLAPEMSLSQW
jgi:hypothetical protein